MLYEEKDLPYNQLTKLGLSKEELIKNNDLEKLLNGEKTGLFKMNNPASVDNEILYGHLKIKRLKSRRLSFEVLKPEFIIAEKGDIQLEKIPFNQIEKFGITKENLKLSGNLTRLLNGEPTEPLMVQAYFNAGMLKSMAKVFLIKNGNGLKFRFDFDIQQSESI